MADKTAGKLPAHERPDLQFRPGQSGNPRGRPKGSKNRLGESFLAALADDFEAHGPAVIAQVREEKPDAYLKVVASVLPKDVNLKTEPFDEMTDEQLLARLRELDAELRPHLEAAVAGADDDEDGPGHAHHR